MDRVTHDLLRQGHISEEQIERLTRVGVKDDTLLETLTKVGAVSVNFVKRFIVEQIRSGHYEIGIIKQYHFLDDQSVVQHLAEVLEIPFLDLDSIDMDYRLTDRIPLSQLKRFQAIPIKENDLSVTVAFADPLNIEAQEALQRLYPRKPLDIATATEKQIQAYLFKVELKDSVKELVVSKRNELNSLGTDQNQDQAQACSSVMLTDAIVKA